MIKPKKELDLKELSTLKIGGIAEAVYFPRSIRELSEVILHLRRNGGRFHVIGKGSNIIFSSKPHKEPIVSTVRMAKYGFYEDVEEASEVFPSPPKSTPGNVESARFIFAECGVMNSSLIRLAINFGLGDITCLAGVPGTFGGALAMNAEGIMNQMEGNMWIAQINQTSDELVVWESRNFSYEYRYSSVQEGIAGAALLRLFPSDPTAMRIRVKELLARRKSTQPLDMPSPGSAFKNPKGDFAGRLLDRCGMKGFRLGDCAFSEKHANFIVNLGNATGDDALKLMAHGKRVVQETFGVWLFPEVKFIGDFDKELLHYVKEVGADEKASS